MRSFQRFLFRMLLGFFPVINTFAQTQLPPLKISHLTGDFYIYTTYKTYKGQPVSSNGMYFLTVEGVVMIDTPWDTTQVQPLLDSIASRHHQQVVLCIATHAHADRTGGFAILQRRGVKTFSSRQTDAMCQASHEQRSQYTFSKDTLFQVGQYCFLAYYAGEGHTKDNIVVWVGQAGILYGGCLIKSSEARDLGYVGEANLKAWPATMRQLQKKFPDVQFIIPGHDDWHSLKAIDHTLELLRQAKHY